MEKFLNMENGVPLTTMLDIIPKRIGMLCVYVYMFNWVGDSVSGVDIIDIVTYSTGQIFGNSRSFSDRILIQDTVSMHTSNLYCFHCIDKHHRLHFDTC
jgi:hypothetical protein